MTSSVPPPGSPSPGIDRSIYGMPAFVTLEVADLDATLSWYVDGLGFVVLFTIPGPGGPALVHLRRWTFQDVLIRPATGPTTPATGASVSFAAVHDEIDALAARARARARAHGGGRVLALADTPWNTRDLITVDPDGNTVVLTAARPAELIDAAFSADMQRWNAEQARG